MQSITPISAAPNVYTKMNQRLEQAQEQLVSMVQQQTQFAKKILRFEVEKKFNPSHLGRFMDTRV
jgi:hypothetical protein